MILDTSGLICGCEVDLISDYTVNEKPVWIITNICDLHDKMFKESRA